MLLRYKLDACTVLLSECLFLSNTALGSKNFVNVSFFGKPMWIKLGLVHVASVLIQVKEFNQLGIDAWVPERSVLLQVFIQMVALGA